MLTTKITKTELTEHELGCITFHYHHDCDDKFEETVEIDPYFYAEAGIPICPGCGDDMKLIGATLRISETA